MQFVKQLFFTVKQAIEKLPGYPDVSPVVIVDDLSILTSLGCKEYDISVFFQYLRTTLCPRGGTIVSLVHSEHNDTHAESRPGSLYRHIGHQSDVIVLVRPLKTGYCRDLSGEVSVLYSSACSCVTERFYAKATNSTDYSINCLKFCQFNFIYNGSNF